MRGARIRIASGSRRRPKDNGQPPGGARPKGVSPGPGHSRWEAASTSTDARHGTARGVEAVRAGNEFGVTDYPRPLRVISAISRVGAAIAPSNTRSFPTPSTFDSMSSEFAAIVTPSTGNAFSPFSIQKPWAWNE